jgi:hypothetical protein
VKASIVFDGIVGLRILDWDSTNFISGNKLTYLQRVRWRAKKRPINRLLKSHGIESWYHRIICGAGFNSGNKLTYLQGVLQQAKRQLINKLLKSHVINGMIECRISVNSCDKWTFVACRLKPLVI